MPHRFRVSPSAGAIALYDIGTNPATADAPLTDPLNNLSRVVFHPALRYPGVISTLTGTLSLPAGKTTVPHLRKATYTLAAHGQAGKPMTLGRLVGLGPGGADVAWCGSIPVQQAPAATFINSAGTSYPGMQTSEVRWLALGATATHLIAHEICRGDAARLPAITISWVVYVFDRNLLEALPSSGPTRMRVNGANLEFQTPKGTFSSAKRYLREGTGGSALAVSGGRTVTMHWTGTLGSSIWNSSTWRFSLGDGNLERTKENLWSTGSPGAPVHVPPAAVAPRIQTVIL